MGNYSSVIEKKIFICVIRNVYQTVLLIRTLIRVIRVNIDQFELVKAAK